MSNSKIQSVRGTQDFLPEQSQAYRCIESLAKKLSELYGYGEIMTPMFEFSEVFHRSLGETSDAVSKETYDFTDRGGDQLTLRPEGTASVVRAFVSNGMAQNLPLKFFYSGPMFRYERPQKGRFRQFHQIGVEALGFDHFSTDVEGIALAWQILKELGLRDKVQLEINSLGDLTSRQKHREALVQYLLPQREQLSADSKIRLEKNPLRILDSKDEGDRKIIAGAPMLKNYLNDESQKYFEQVLQGLRAINIEPVLNERLVRGLDYYTHTVFEITTTHLGSQGALIAGGRYDGLVKQMGGPETTGFGWGCGIERLMLLTDAGKFNHATKLVAVIPADESCEKLCLKISDDLRQRGIHCEFIASGNVGKKLKRANKLSAAYAIIVGETEKQKNVASVKNLGTGEQKEIQLSDLPQFPF